MAGNHKAKEDARFVLGLFIGELAVDGALDLTGLLQKLQNATNIQGSGPGGHPHRVGDGVTEVPAREMPFLKLGWCVRSAVFRQSLRRRTCNGVGILTLSSSWRVTCR